MSENEAAITKARVAISSCQSVGSKTRERPLTCPDFLSRIDVPQYFPICQRVVDQWIADQAVPVIRLGRKPIFRRVDIETYLNAHRSVPIHKPKVGRPTKAEEIARRGSEQATPQKHKSPVTER